MFAYGSSCDLSSLRGTAIGAELVRLRGQRHAPRRDPGGAQPPAGDGRRDVDLGPEGDDRGRGPPVLRARRGRCRGHRARGGCRRARRSHRRGRLDDHAAARPRPLHLPGANHPAEAEGGVPCGEARRCLGQAADPHDVPESRLLREPGIRNRGSVPHVLLEARHGAHALRVGVPRGPDPGSIVVRPDGHAGAGACSAERGARGDARHARDHAAAIQPGGRLRRSPASRREVLHADPRAVLLRVRPRRADRHVRRGTGARRRLPRVYDDPAALPATCGGGDPQHADVLDRSCRCAHLDQPADGGDPRDGGGDSQPAQEPVQPALPGAATDWFHVQDVRARGRGRDGVNPDSTYYVSAPFIYKGDKPERELRGQVVVVRAHVRQQLLGLDVDQDGDDPLRQRGLRAADPRRDARAGGRRRAKDGRSIAARRERRVRPRDGPRVDRGLAARHRVRVRDARGRRHVRAADGDPQGRAPERKGRPRGGLGQAAATPCDLRGHCGDRHAHPGAERAVRHRCARRHRQARRGQDRDERGACGRVVRRLHA